MGGGPAGAAVAISLARLGIEVTVLEAGAGPGGSMIKVGESLPPSANPILERLGLLDAVGRAGLPSFGNRSCWGSPEPVERDFFFGAAGIGWRIDRQLFDAELAAVARDAGVDWRDGVRVQDFTAFAGSARVVVDATGRAGRVARSFGARRVRYDRLVGVVAYGTTGRCAAHDHDATTLVEAAPDGWWYSLFLPGGRLAVAYLTDGDLLDRAVVRSAAELVRWAEVTGASETSQRLQTVGGAGPWDGPYVRPAHTERLTAVTGPDWLAVGEAAFAVDPLSSYGITAALGAGFYAAAALAEHLGGRADALTAYAELIDHTFAQYLIMCHDRYSLERRWPDSEFWRRRRRSPEYVHHQETGGYS